MLPRIGPVELILILVIVTMLFGVGKLPEVFGAVGRGIREFRRGASEDETSSQVTTNEGTTTEATTVETPAETRTETTTVSTAGDGNTHQG
ncbi:MAG: twin-arginine translocase TatA/TatE family subunit [Caldilineaceae bacterium]|nr:twin-arginine translocase TatA/TatE family subunit [Caldilineaceae bacterium]